MTWNPPTDAELGPEKPGLSSVFIRMRDMVASAFAAELGAPTLDSAALTGYPFSAAGDITGTWALIDSWTPTAVNSKDFTWDESLYSEIKIIIEGVIPATDDALLRGRIGYDDGVTFFTGAGDYMSYIESISNGVYASDTSFPSDSIPLSHVGGVAGGVGSAAGEGFSGTFKTIGWNSAVSRPAFTADESYDDNGGIYVVGKSWGTVADTLADTTVMDSFRVYWSTGNFEAVGTIKIYGLKVA